MENNYNTYKESFINKLSFLKEKMFGEEYEEIKNSEITFKYWNNQRNIIKIDKNAEQVFH